jgi:lipid-binding SYLF domain-containing protein
MSLVAKAADDTADQDRVKASGQVLTELLNSPSSISRSLLNKADCVVILPSVKKASFIVGAQYAEASTTASMSAQMLSYSRSQGVFAGISLSGTSLGPDSGANEKIYGKKVSGKEIFSSGMKPPASASGLLSTLNAKSPASAHPKS